MEFLILLQYKYSYKRFEGFDKLMKEYDGWVVALGIALPFVILAVLVLFFWFKKKKQR